MIIEPGREITLKNEHQIIGMHKFLQWGIVALCVTSLIFYLLYSMAAEKYIALYVTLLKKIPIFLGI